jgi:hypothetical protein
LKREVALKSQIETIEKKFEHNKIKAAEKKQQKEIEIDE